MTYVPTMIFKSCIFAYLRQSYRIEVARYRLLKIYLSGVVRFLNQAITPSVMIRPGKDTIFVIHNRGNPLSGMSFTIEVTLSPEGSL